MSLRADKTMEDAYQIKITASIAREHNVDSNSLT